MSFVGRIRRGALLLELRTFSGDAQYLTVPFKLAELLHETNVITSTTRFEQH